MNLPDLIDHIFDAESEVSVFDQDTESEIKVTSENLEAANAAIKDMETPCIDLVSDDKLYGVAVWDTQAGATFSLSKNDDTISVFLLSEPVDPDTISDDMLTEIPFSWHFELLSGEYFTLEEVNAILVEEGETADVSDDDTAQSVSVENEDAPSENAGSGASAKSSEEPASDESAPDEELTLINDAEVIGTQTDEMVELLSQNVVFMTGELWDQGDRRNTPAGKWKRNEMTWGDLLTHEKSPLTNHAESGHKQGLSVVLGETIDGNRNAESVKSLYAVVIDIDSGPKVDDVIDKLEEMGLFALVYTSFNHNKSKVVLKHDDVVRKMKLDDTPNRTQVIEYLRNHHKDRYDEDFLEEIEITDARSHGPKGLQIILETPPLNKFRIVLPLREPVHLADLGTTASQWKDAWADIVTGFVVNELGVSFDSTSCDVNRLFYTPRHPKEAEWDCALIMGKPLDVADVKPHSKDSYVKNRDNDPFAYGLEKDDTPPICMTPKGKSLNEYHKKAKGRLLLPDLILSEAPDKVRREVSDGKIEIECPFEHEHSTEGGTGTVVMSPEVNEYEVWTVSCPHDACQGRHKLQFLEEMLKAEWFPEEMLKDPEFLLGAEDDEEEEEKRPEPPKDSEGKERTVVDMARDLPDDLDDDKIEAFIRRAIKLGVNNTQTVKILDIIFDKSVLGKNDLKKMWKQVAGALSREQQEEAMEDLSNFEGDPVTNEWDFMKLAEFGTRRIQDYNEKYPTLFHYMEEMARIEENSEGKPQIRMMSLDKFHAELNYLAKWVEVTYNGDTPKTKGVTAPLPLVKQLYNSRSTTLPPLRGLITSPAYVGTGQLVNDAGYHSNCALYYEPDLSIDIPKIMDAPTPEAVREAAELLIDVVADFPLGGFERADIETLAFSEGGIPAVAHCLALILLLFCRDMIKGPTPGHLFTKPAPGTGASLLTDVCTTIACGFAQPAASMPNNDDEMRKTLITFMQDGSPVIFFDNINNSVDSGELASAMTAPIYRARKLGGNQTIETEVRSAFVFTGNNVLLSNELLRRLVMIDLDAKVAQPEARTHFKYDDILAHVKENRGALVHACLTLIQNWIAKGQPHFSGTILNSYENWTRIMGGILSCAGINGFLGNREMLKEIASDDSDEEIMPLLDEWWENFGNERTVVKINKDIPSLMNLALDNDIQLPIRMKPNVDGDRILDGKAFGKFLAANRGRVFVLTSGEEVMLERIPTRHKHGTLWKLSQRDDLPEEEDED